MSKDKNAKADTTETETAEIKTGTRKVALLIDGPAGAAGSVVTLDAAEADSLVAGGSADDNPAAVAYRESLVAPAAGETVLS